MNISALSSSTSSTPTYQQKAQQLATSQTISSSSEDRIYLLTSEASSGYSTPLQQAWADLTGSLNTAWAGSAQGTGDLNVAKTALATYTQLLPSSSLYMSSMTAPSQTFLKDLSNLKSAIDSGDVASAKKPFSVAQADAPDNVSEALSSAAGSGDTDNMARLMMEGAANISGYLTSIGYTQSNATVEANALMLGSITENPVVSTVQDQAQETEVEQQVTQIATSESTSAPTSNQLVATGESAMYKAYKTIFDADPLAIKNSNLNKYNEWDAALKQLSSSLTQQISGAISSTATSGVSVSA